MRLFKKLCALMAFAVLPYSAVAVLGITQADAASIIFDSFNNDLASGAVVPSTDTYYVMLVTSSYTPVKGTHTKRSDVTNEVTGTGYTSGGAVTTASVTNDTTNHRLDITFSDVNWTTSTITAAAAVIYKHRGGASSADNLVAYIDFGGNVSTTAGTFTAHFTGPLRIQN